ncbi:MAG TPA: hypothetical protein VET83_11295 [Candidatus Dormibacteraeota bacterium]|nr:hypothetical protein [Candidatus Dormibacteraeota bacterium]
MKKAVSLRISAVVALCALAWGAQAAGPQPARKRAAAQAAPQEAVDRMLARVFRAAEVRSRVTITRSDPFGGPGERSQGRVWFLPGRGLRYRSDEKGGEDIVVDREQRTFLVYRPSEQVVYRADWDRAPARMRQLIEEPERILEAKFRAARERRLVGGVWREGYRMQRATLGDSLPSVAVWIAADPGTGLPRWITAGGSEDSIDVEFRSLTILPKAVTGDLHLSLPHDVRTEPLDPRDLLPGGESR